MQRGRDPANIYSFAAYVYREDYERTGDILFNANRFGNALVAIELHRREECEKILRQCSKDYTDARAKEDALVDHLQAIGKELDRYRQKKRQKKTPKELREKYTEVEGQLEKHRNSVVLPIRRELYRSPKVKKPLKKLHEKVTADKKEVRANRNCYWGTGGLVEKAHENDGEGPPPSFKRFDGTGRIGVQLQQQSGAPPWTPERLTRENTLLMLDVDQMPDDFVGADLNTRYKKSQKKRCPVRMRIGSEKAKPVWLDFMVKFHRPLPEGCKIKAAWILFKKVGTHTKTYFQTQVARPEGFMRDDVADGGHVAVDLGWRKFEDDRVRVAYWLGDDGEQGEIALDPELLSRDRKNRSLQSIYDRQFDSMKELLHGWITEHKSSVPEWLKEETKTLPIWRSRSRLAKVIIKWRKHQFDGDVELYKTAEKWRKKDKHLFDWHKFQARIIREKRKALFREEAAKLARRYRCVIFEDMKISDMAKDSPVSSDDMDPIKDIMKLASPGELRMEFESRFRDSTRQKTKNTTRECSECGFVDGEFDFVNLYHECPNCQAEKDQDLNACENLLARELGPPDASAA